MNALDTFLFGVYPYIAFTVFLVGSFHHILTGQSDSI